MKRLIQLTLALVLAVGVLAVPLALSAQEEELQVSTSPVHWMSDESEVEDTVSVIVRQEDEVAMMLHAAGFTPGDAVTAWWVIFNNPGVCSPPGCGSDDLPQNGGDAAVEAAMIYADGHVIGDDGWGRFTARLRVADTTGATVFDTEGLVDIQNAEIHLVTRTHGPVIEDMLDVQLSTLNGGCENGSEGTGAPGPNTCANLMGSTHLAPQS